MWTRRLLASGIFLVISTRSEATSATKKDDSYRYLYEGTEQNQAGYVLEHIAPETPTERISDQPNFLFSEDQGYRVVIFYIDWCPVCQSVVPEYIDFARRMKAYNVSVHAVSCMINKPLCLRLRLAGYPMIRLYAPRQVVEGQDLSLSELHPLRVLEHFQIPVEDGAKKVLLEEIPTASSSLHFKSQLDWRAHLFNRFSRLFGRNGALATKKPSYRRTPQELEADIHRSLDLTLRSSVFTTPDGETVSEETKATLLNWLMILDKTLPPSWVNLHTLLHDVVGNFVFATKSEAYLVSYLDRNPPNASHWSSACSGDASQPDSNGYSCGLWAMFHAVTVGAVEFNTMSMKRNRLATEVVARNIRDFVGTFFNCQSCRTHFVKSFEACEHRRCQLLSLEAQNQTTPQEWWQLPQWLARVHNEVNVRKAEKLHFQRNSQEIEFSDDQKAEALWPSSLDCKSCWTSASSPTQREWVEEAVYEYLKREYFTGYPSKDAPLLASSAFASEDSNEDVRLVHFVLSCLLVALLFCMWDATRSYLRRLADRLTPKHRFE